MESDGYQQQIKRQIFMKLIDYCNKYYLVDAKSDETVFEKLTRDRKARAECASSLGMSRDDFNYLV